MRKGLRLLQRWLAGPARLGLSFAPVFVSKLPVLMGFKLIFIMPAVGLLHLASSLRLSPMLWPLVSLIFIGVANTLFQQDLPGLVRLGQVFSMLCFAQYLMDHFSSADFERLERSLLVAAALYLVGEAAFVGFIPDKEILPGVRVPRLLGIVGESNYSGMLCAVVTVSIWLRKKSWWCLLGTVTVLLTSSRISMLVLLMGACWPGLGKLPGRWQVRLLWSALLLWLCYPLVLWALEKCLPLETQRVVHHLYSGRFGIHLSYLAMFRDHPFGVGYFRGPQLFTDYAALGSQLMQSGYQYPIDHPPVYQQHGLLIHVLSEFGILGYAMMAYFFVKAMSQSLLKNPTVAFGLMCALTGFLTLNVLSDFTLIFSLVRFSLAANKY